MNRGRLLDAFVVWCLGAVLVAGCGGGGQARRPVDGGLDAVSDAPASQNDRPADVGSAGGMTGADGAAIADAYVGDAGDAGPAVARKALGMPCAAALECASGFCADGVCCSSACTEACRDVRRPGQRRHLPARRAGHRPARRVRRRGHRRAAARPASATAPARARKYPAGRRVQGAGVHRIDADVGVPLRRQRHLRVDAGPVVRAVQLRDADGRCLTICTGDADCVAPNSCINGSCGKKPIGGACGGGRRVQLRLLRAGRLLRQRLRRAPAGRARCPAASAPAPTCPTAPTRWASAPTRAPPTCGTDGTCDGNGGLPAVRLRHACAWRRPARASPPPCPAAATAPASCCRGTPAGVRSVRLRDARRVPRPRAPPTPTARAATSATGRSAARRSTAPTAPPAPSARRARASRASAARARAPASARRARSTGQARRLHADPRQHRSAQPVRRRRIVQLRHRRLVQRRRRLPAVPAGPRVRRHSPAPARR